MSDHVLGVDLGGSNVRIVLSDADGRSVAEATAETTQTDADAAVAQLVELARELVRGADVAWSSVAAMGVGVAGVVHVGADGLRLAPNLPLLAELDLGAALRERLGLPVVLDNDVNMATLAEQRHGLGAGLSDFVFIAVGTGVGMGVVSSGRLQRGAGGAAGEIGFLPLGRDPFARANQTHGPLEEAVGGVGVARRYAELTGSPDGVLSTREIFDRRDAGDPDAHAVLDAQARTLALAVLSTTSVLDPALVVLGGGIGSRPDVVARVRTYFARLTLRRAPIEASELGERAGLVGAAELARIHVDGQHPIVVGPLAGSDGDG